MCQILVQHFFFFSSILDNFVEFQILYSNTNVLRVSIRVFSPNRLLKRILPKSVKTIYKKI